MTGLVAVLLFFLVVGGVAWYNIRTLKDDNEKIIHSHEVMITLDELLSSVKDAETGQRGYLLTDSDRYLEPYNAAVLSLKSQIADLQDLTRDNPRQQGRIGALKVHIEAKLAELRETIMLRQTRGEEAALALVRSDRGKAEMDTIRAQLALMAQEEASLRQQRLTEMEAAYETALASGILSGLLGMVLTFVVGLLVVRATAARQRQDWLQSGQMGLSAAMQGDQRTEELGENILQFLARYLDAHAGALFVRSGGEYRRVASYGVPADAPLPDRFGPREGLLGQAAAEGRPIVIRDVPEGYLTIGSALGRDRPRDLIVATAGFEGGVNAVIELGFIHKMDDLALALLDHAGEAIGVAVRSADYRSELQDLVEETQRQSEELQVQSEELRVSNEELEEQSRALKESQVRLEQQQAELETTNAQLEEQAQQLEVQRDDLARTASAVQLKARELEQASQYKSDFLANMSHELRTPLNSLLILAKLLSDNPLENLTVEQVKFARTIQSSGSDLLNLINDILDLSKIEAGHVEIRPEAVAVERLVKEVQQTFDPVARERKLEFAVEVAPECPPLIETDAHRLQQVLKNLLSNAFKFTEQGKVDLTIRRASEGRVALAVRDTGIGMTPEQQQTVFDAFRQADGTISRKYGGTGLGLSISRELARLLGGTISLRSALGQGSTFTVELPVTYDPAAVVARPDRAAAPAVEPVVSEPSAQTLTPVALPRKLEDDRDHLDADAPEATRRILLVIEDDETFAGILRDLSREMGFQALVASTAEEALALARQHMPSAVVLDVGLPDQSGLSVLDRLKRDVETRHIPIHVVSGSDHAQTALSLGAVGYMLKPVKREDLAEVLRRLEAKLSQRMHRVLVVEDDAVQRDAVERLLASQDVETVAAGTAAECLDLLKVQTFDCMVLDLSLPDASGYSLLETLSREEAYSFPPVIVYTGRDLSIDDEQKLRRYSKSIIIKGAKSPERLLDEVSLFLHQVVSDLSDEQQKMIRKAAHRDAILEGRRILVVEDDIRNVYALTNILEPRGAVVEIARNGREALEVLDKASAQNEIAIDLVLMDVMMPVMDGLAATRAIRSNPAWKALPVITLTAKAMPDDQERCIEAGANDYMAKPLDVDKLLSLVRVWMPR
ncbi:response regulator [Novosphingobium rosa]|uniref:response regulator n=1 Tax=Novosphingobium rosa TaxID=76978 RepID=UPI000835EDE9